MLKLLLSAFINIKSLPTGRLLFGLLLDSEVEGLKDNKLRSKGNAEDDED
jgi:hypothetical protein